MNDFEIWPGPMEGIGEAGFVRTVNALDLTERWMTPFCRISSAVPRKGKLREFISPYLGSGLPFHVQLMGCDGKLLGATANLFMELGADGINLNFGCPSNRVTSGGAGGGAWKTPEQILSLCADVREALAPDVPLSIKSRTGWSDPMAMQNIFAQLAEAGTVDKIFLHYRTTTEQYSPAPLPHRVERWITGITAAAPLPVVINGDICEPSEAKDLLSITGACGVMAARSWMKNPFLLRAIAGKEVPDPEEGRELFFAKFKSETSAPGAILEAARMLWGINDPHFRKLLQK